MNVHLDRETPKRQRIASRRARRRRPARAPRPQHSLLAEMVLDGRERLRAHRGTRLANRGRQPVARSPARPDRQSPLHSAMRGAAPRGRPYLTGVAYDLQRWSSGSRDDPFGTGDHSLCANQAEHVPRALFVPSSVCRAASRRQMATVSYHVAERLHQPIAKNTSVSAGQVSPSHRNGSQYHKQGDDVRDLIVRAPDDQTCRDSVSAPLRCSSIVEPERTHRTRDSR